MTRPLRAALSAVVLVTAMLSPPTPSAAQQPDAATPGAVPSDVPDDPTIDPELSARDAEALAADREVAALAEGQALPRVVELATGGDGARALALVDALHRGGRSAELPEAEWAALRYAEGLLAVAQEPRVAELVEPYAPPLDGALAQVERARTAFADARGLAGGDPELRRRAVYAAGTLELWLAERALRAFVVANGPGAQQQTMPVPGAEPPDPKAEIQVLIDSFVVARDFLAERVRLDWRDEDPRANLEWAQRRIRELEQALEDIEEQEEQQQQGQEQQEGEEGEEGEPSESDEQQDSEDQQEGDPQDQEGEDGEEEQGESGEDQQVDDTEREQQQQQSSEGGEMTEEEREQQADELAEQLEQMSIEEIMQLMDQLEQIDRNGEEIRRQLRGIRRVPVERDW